MKIFKSKICVIILGFFAGVFSVYFYNAFRHAHRVPHISGYKKSLPIMPITLDPSWIKSGNPVVKSIEFTSSTSFNSFSGIFEVEGPTVFEWQFGLDESIYILEGKVDIEYRGKLYKLVSGDTAFFHRDSKAIFRVDKGFKKAWTCYQPGSIANFLVDLKHQTITSN